MSASQIGALATVGLVLASTIAGAVLLRHQGFGVMRRVRTEMDAGRDPSRQLAHGAMIVLAAILLIIPGFITDIFAILLLLPPVRDLAWRMLKAASCVGDQLSAAAGFRTEADATRSSISTTATIRAPTITAAARTTIRPGAASRTISGTIQIRDEPKAANLVLSCRPW